MKMLKKLWSSFKPHFGSSFLSGVCISIGCIVNLKVGGLWGAILFSFGLLTVCYYGLKLYTGTAGFIKSRELGSLIHILFGNVVGALGMMLLCSNAIPEITESAASIVQNRLNHGAISCGLLAIGCGFIMTTAVQHYREGGKVLPILIGVPVFILCGFAHSIADSFYFLVGHNYSFALLWVWIMEVLGNFIGCNLYRWIIRKDERLFKKNSI